MTQKEAYGYFFPEIDQRGKIYKKYSLIYAYLAEPNEYIETWTKDGLETTNYAKFGDFVVQNLQTEFQEKYIVSEKMFFERYKYFYNHDKGAIYMPTGKIKACIYHGEDLEFIANWGRLMALKTGDYIVSPYPGLNEVYRIARQEFMETYEEDL